MWKVDTSPAETAKADTKLLVPPTRVATTSGPANEPATPMLLTRGMPTGASALLNCSGTRPQKGPITPHSPHATTQKAPTTTAAAEELCSATATPQNPAEARAMLAAKNRACPPLMSLARAHAPIPSMAAA